MVGRSQRKKINIIKYIENKIIMLESIINISYFNKCVKTLVKIYIHFRFIKIVNFKYLLNI